MARKYLEEVKQKISLIEYQAANVFRDSRLAYIMHEKGLKATSSNIKKALKLILRKNRETKENIPKNKLNIMDLNDLHLSMVFIPPKGFETVVKEGSKKAIREYKKQSSIIR